MSIRWGKVCDEVYRELFEWHGGGGWDGSEWGVSRVVIDFVLLAYGTSSNETVDKRGQSRPPEVTFQECFGVESSSMSGGRRVVYGANYGLLFVWRDVHATLEV